MKNLRKLTSILLVLISTFILFSCTMLQQKEETSISLDMVPIFEQARNLARETGGSVRINIAVYTINVTLKRADGSTETKTVKSVSENDIEGKIITFNEIPLGEKVSINLEVLQNDKVQFVGSKNNIIVNSENTIVDIVLKKVGSSENEEQNEDTTPPENVTELKAEVKSSSILLTWIDSISTDVYGYEVTWDKNYAMNRSAVSNPIQSNSMMVAHGNGGCYISNLEVEKEYIFTVKTVDTSGNYSEGVTVKVFIEFVAPSGIKLSFTTENTEPTNENIQVNVITTFEDDASIILIKYKKEIVENAQSLLEDNEAINITETQSFEAFENGTYSIACLDSKGRTEIGYTVVSNIDKTPPQKVQNFCVSQKNTKLHLSWDTPVDDDIKNIKIFYAKEGGIESQETLNASQTNYDIDLQTEDQNDKTFTITVLFEDNVGNISEQVTQTITTSNNITITSVTLDRVHISSVDTNRNIIVTIQGTNFSQIAEREDKTIKIYFTQNGNLVGEEITATIDTNNTVATAVISAPVPASNTADGIDYVLVTKLCGSEVTLTNPPTLNVSTKAKLSSFQLINIGTEVTKIQKAYNTITPNTTIKVKITGTNLDIANDTTLQYYNLDNVPVGEPIPLDVKGLNSKATTLEQNIVVPQKSGMYKLKCFGVSDVLELQLHDEVSFESIYIPKVGKHSEDYTITARVKGKNFLALDVYSTDFSISCSSQNSITSSSSIAIIDDETIECTLTIQKKLQTGSYEITFSKGLQSITGNLLVNDYSDWNVGDVILRNGTRILYDNERTSFTEDVKNNAISVIAGFTNNYVPFGIGLQISSKVIWAPSGTLGYRTKFKDNTISITNEIITGGDVDGSDNWDYICRCDPNGTKNPEKNYPAFNYALKYGELMNLTGDYKNTWYLPSISELNNIKESVINPVLEMLNKKTLVKDNGNYWSSSDCSQIQAYYLLYNDSNAKFLRWQEKKYDMNVLVIRLF